MRDFINAVLAFIGTSSLTDNEFDALTITVAGYDAATYSAIDAVLVSREGVSTMRDRLRYVFLAKGIELPAQTEAKKSNILVGGVL